jgi:hypothetical protein
MNEDRLKILLAEFAEAARKQHAASEQGDYRAANGQTDRMHELFQEIKAHGDTGRQALLHLVNSTDAPVSLAAASYSVSIAPVVCRAAFRRVAKQRGLIGFIAQQALKHWADRKGQLEESPETHDEREVTSNRITPAPCDLSPVSLAQWLLHTPAKYVDKEIEAFDNLGDRMGLASAYLGDIIGGLPDGLEWTPNSSPPSIEEKLVWLWVVRPSMIGEILAYARQHSLRDVSEYLGPEAASEQ